MGCISSSRKTHDVSGGSTSAKNRDSGAAALENQSNVTYIKSQGVIREQQNPATQSQSQIQVSKSETNVRVVAEQRKSEPVATVKTTSTTTATSLTSSSRVQTTRQTTAVVTKKSYVASSSSHGFGRSTHIAVKSEGDDDDTGNYGGHESDDRGGDSSDD